MNEEELLEYTKDRVHKNALFLNSLNISLKNLQEMIDYAITKFNVSSIVVCRNENNKHSSINEKIKYLANFLKVDTSITVFEFQGEITDKQIEYLAEAIKENNTVTHLLFNSNLTPKGIKYLTNALKENTKIKVMDFGNQNITDLEAFDLLTMIEKNKTLESLHFDSHLLSKEIINLLIKTLKAYNEKLCICFNNLSSYGENYLTDVTASTELLEILEPSSFLQITDLAAEGKLDPLYENHVFTLDF